jgi:hypothetical protein
MSAQEQARLLMLRHHHMVKNRQQSMLSRVNSEIGMPGEVSYRGHIQGKPAADARRSYDRSGSSLS